MTYRIITHIDLNFSKLLCEINGKVTARIKFKRMINQFYGILCHIIKAQRFFGRLKTKLNVMKT